MQATSGCRTCWPQYQGHCHKQKVARVRFHSTVVHTQGHHNNRLPVGVEYQKVTRNVDTESVTPPRALSPSCHYATKKSVPTSVSITPPRYAGHAASATSYHVTLQNATP